MNEQNPTSDSAIEKSIATYSNATWLRTTVVGAAGAMGVVFPAVPAVVGAIDVAITTKAQKIAERRLNQLCQSWESEMQLIPTQFVDRDYIESEEFFDLIFKAWESAKRTRHNEKIHLYAKVLTQSVPQQNRNEHSPEDYLSVLAELSLNEIEVARALYSQQKERPLPNEGEWEWLMRIGATERESKEFAWGQRTKVLALCPSIETENMEFVLLRLQRSGLVKELSGTYWDYTGGVYYITESLRKLMEYLERDYPREQEK